MKTPHATTAAITALPSGLGYGMWVLNSEAVGIWMRHKKGGGIIFTIIASGDRALLLLTRATQKANHHRNPQRRGGWGECSYYPPIITYRSEIFTRTQKMLHQSSTAS